MGGECPPLNMKTLSTQTKKIRAVINPPIGMDKEQFVDVFKTTLKDFLDSSGYLYFAIVHDMDYDDKGNKKTLHAHIVINSQKRMRVMTFIYRLSDALSWPENTISAMGYDDLATSVQYLVHKNNPEKWRYDSEEVMTNCPTATLYDLLSSDLLEVDARELCRLIDEGYSDRDIAFRIGLGAYSLYRNAIRDFRKERYSITDENRKDVK